MVNKLTFFWVFIISLVCFSAVGKRFVRCQLIISTFVLYAIWVYYHKKHLLICMWHSRVPTTRGCKCACVSMCACARQMNTNHPMTSAVSHTWFSDRKKNAGHTYAARMGPMRSHSTHKHTLETHIDIYIINVGVHRCWSIIYVLSVRLYHFKWRSYECHRTLQPKHI